jgi:hypothetical protein
MTSYGIKLRLKFIYIGTRQSYEHVEGAKILTISHPNHLYLIQQRMKMLTL